MSSQEPKKEKSVIPHSPSCTPENTCTRCSEREEKVNCNFCGNSHGNATCKEQLENKSEEICSSTYSNKLPHTKQGESDHCLFCNKVMEPPHEVQSEWRERFDRQFGTLLIEQKAKLYNNGSYSIGWKRDWESAKNEVEEIKDFIAKELESATAQARENAMKEFKDKITYFAQETIEEYRKEGLSQGIALCLEKIKKMKLKYELSKNNKIFNLTIDEVLESLQDKYKGV